MPHRLRVMGVSGDYPVRGGVMEIPYGYCHCGCGEKTSIAKKTLNRLGHVKGEPVRFIIGHHQRGQRHPYWNGGHSKQYPRVKFPEHPKAGKRGWVREHILLAEQAFGKALPPKVIVHHHTSNQLVICQDHAYHKLLHDRQKALQECGHANWRKCCRCHEWDSPDNLIINTQAYHQKCNAWHTRLRWLRGKYGNQI